MGLIGFGKDIEKTLLAATSPFVFSTVNERSILRFLKLLGCDNGKIGTYAKRVDDRNDSAHPNCNIFFSTQAALDTKITEILRVVDEIQTHSGPVIEHCYQEFLLHSHDPDEREYPDAADPIREVLIHGNDRSPKGIEIYLAFGPGVPMAERATRPCARLVGCFVRAAQWAMHAARHGGCLQHRQLRFHHSPPSSPSAPGSKPA